MRIEYECSRIGYGACWVDYPGSSAAQITATPAELDFGDVDIGTSADLAVTIKNVGTDPLEGSAGGLGAPYSIVGLADYNLAPGASTTVTVRFTPTLRGEFAGSLACTGGGGVNVDIVGYGVGDGVPADQCEYAPLLIGDGTLTGSNATANTSTSATCGGGGTADVWWMFRPPFAGTATIDTTGSDFDTVLSVYAACDGTQLACNDDYAGDPTSRVEVGVFAATIYFCRVAGVAGQTGNVVLNISTSPNPLDISGLITDATGDSIGGVALEGLPEDVNTTASGRFSATVDYGFTGTISPVKEGWTFVPAERSFTALTTDQANVDFIGQEVLFRVSGCIVDAAGNALPGVVINGLPGVVVTNTSGCYAAEVPYGFSGMAAPSRFGYDFEPAQQTFDDVTADVAEQDYLAIAQRGDLKVILSPGGEPRESGLWRVDSGPWRESGETVEDLTVGVHLVEYGSLTGWEAPRGRARVGLARPPDNRGAQLRYRRLCADGGGRPGRGRQRRGRSEGTCRRGLFGRHGRRVGRGGRRRIPPE